MSNSITPIPKLLELLNSYQSEDSQQLTLVETFRQFYLNEPEAFERSCSAGHFTGSAWVVSADGTCALLTHHRKLDRWLQLGGHADGNIDLQQVALQEAKEESGLVGLKIESAIFDLDLHRIPAYKTEPLHWHYDVRFVVWANITERFRVSEESHDLAWWPLEEVIRNSANKTDESVQRMAKKWQERMSRS